MLPKEYRINQRWIILAQCSGIFASVFFLNNQVLLYFLAIGMTAGSALIVISLLDMIRTILIIPMAFLAEKIGKKILGQSAIISNVIGFTLLLSLSWIASDRIQWIAILGILFYAIGGSMYRSGWFALIYPHIEEDKRGRFFGKLRSAFMILGFVYTFSSGLILSGGESVAVFRNLLIFITAGIAFQFYLYSQIPEVNSPKSASASFSLKAIIKSVKGTPGLFPLALYLFMMPLFTDGTLAIFSIAEKNTLSFSDSTVSILSSMTLAGMFCAFLSVGYFSDKLGNNVLFPRLHLLYFLSICVYLIILWSGYSNPIAYGFIHFMYGIARGTYSILSTKEIFAIIGPEYRSVSTTFLVTVGTVASSLSIFIPGLILENLESWKLDIFSDSFIAIILIVMAFGSFFGYKLLRWRQFK